MSEPVPIIWHYRDWEQLDTKVTMCGVPLPPESAGPTQPCEECLARWKEQRRANRDR